MILDYKQLEIEGVKLFSIKSYKDTRGVFSEVFLSNLDYPEFKLNYIQENESISEFGVFRGMHFQKGEYSQSKLIRVVKGKVLDIICDLRKSSSSFKKIISVELNPNNLFFIPKGIAHGFLSLEEGTILNYKCDRFYNHNSESGFNVFKSDLNIDFQIDKDKIILSDKDNRLPHLDKSYIYKNL